MIFWLLQITDNMSAGFSLFDECGRLVEYGK